jgi:hypothetical protein
VPRLPAYFLIQGYHGSSNSCSAPAGASTAPNIGQFAKQPGLQGTTGIVLHDILALAGLALSILGFVEIGCLRGTAGPNEYGSSPLAR